MDSDIKIPDIDTSGPNPFDIPEDLMKRLQEIDQIVGKTNEDTEESPKSLQEINEELLKLYQSDLQDSKTETKPEIPKPIEPVSKIIPPLQQIPESTLSRPKKAATNAKRNK